jgi:hypothetical protein
MKAGGDEAAEFRAECLKWQTKFGLTDWTLQFKTEDGSGKHDEAEVDYDCETRHATITYYLGVTDSLHPKDTALHEVLHLLFADMLLAAVNSRRGDEADSVTAREEHKAIERLLKVLK